MPELASPVARWTTSLLAVGPARGHRARLELAALLALVIAIGLVDRSTGYEIRFGVFYLVPVSIATVRCGLRAALGVVVLSTLVGAGPAGPSDARWTIDLLNVTFRFVMLAFVAGLLSLLIRAIAEARASDRRSREFLQYAAHQLRTPITSVSTTAQGLLATGRHGPDEAALVRLVSESNRLGRLVAAMLRFLRLQRGEVAAGPQAELRDVAEEEARRWADLVAPLALHLEAPEGPTPLLVPEEATREVLELLLDNARRHARSQITVSAVGADGGAELQVRDDGPGLPPGQEELAFAPFVSLDGGGGSGLGLAIGRRLLAAIGGSLRYEDGAFVARLPAGVDEPAHQPRPERALAD